MSLSKNEKELLRRLGLGKDNKRDYQRATNHRKGSA